MGRWNEGLHLDNFPLAVSVGIAAWRDGETLDEVLDAADQDMYACKRAKAQKIHSRLPGWQSTSVPFS
jgi:GGDEF domain-containing protein